MFGKRKKVTFCGFDYEALCAKLERLDALENDIILTDDEKKVVHDAALCVSGIIYAMTNGGKVAFDK